ncbi:hypothetical protein GOP47_0007232 [Adiantum capillus-veneris]|uniref:Uncharacterized protein n=1 Tax=Adiantum capillus-veneris TaxID=13818 RepID=A0A9D4ZJ11_ADICA|nr:hypothetical protein GOP47_0007232 [Adiantum capillus-veneris]
MACPHAFRPVGRAAIGAVRHIFACSRPHHHHASTMELESDDNSIDGDVNVQDERSGPARDDSLNAGKDIITSANTVGSASAASKYQSLAELHAVLRHIEVRWQLFNESMSKFHDAEAMLANCTDDVVWSTENGNMIRGKNQELLALLRSFIERKVSLEVEIESIIRITLSGCADLMLDKHGQCGPPSALELARTSAALKALNLIDPISQCLIQSPTSFASTSTTASSSSAVSRPPFSILAKDSYTLKGNEGDVVERGRRAVLWQQHKSSWYIRGYLCY